MADTPFDYHWRCQKTGLTHLCFAYDLLLFCGGSLPSVELLHKALHEFYSLSGLLPNNGKSSVYLLLVETQDFWRQSVISFSSKWGSHLFGILVCLFLPLNWPYQIVNRWLLGLHPESLADSTIPILCWMSPTHKICPMQHSILLEWTFYSPKGSHQASWADSETVPMERPSTWDWRCESGVGGPFA